MANVSSSNGIEKCPRLRFPEFTKPWESVQLGALFKKNTQKNSSGIVTNVICNSAKNGLIPQKDYFDKDIANADNTAGYYIISKNDFVYNPRKSADAPYGPISRYTYEDDGIVSPLYLCFRGNEDVNPEYFERYFRSSAWHRYIYMSGDSGARHDRVSIKDDTFFEMPIYLPCNNEQTKIANFLSLLEKKIEYQNALAANLKKYKRGFIELFFDDNTLRQKDEYRVVSLGEIANLRGRIGFRGYTRGDIVNKGEGAVSFSPSNIMNGFVNFEECTYISETKYFESPEIMVAQNDILFTKTGSTIGKIGYVKELKERATINPQIALITAHSCDPYYLFLAMSRKSASDYVRSISVGGAIPTLSQEQLKQLSIPLISIKKQEELSSFVLGLDERIDCAIQTLTQLNKLKIGLLQQLFV